MPFINIKNINILGISTTVPKQKSINTNAKFISTTGVEETRISNPTTCTSDLCLTSANKLIDDLNINKNDINVLIFVSQTPDYKLPVTSTILQHRLGLSQSCICLDIPLGCSGYVYGLYTISSLISSGKLKKGLLLVGDTISKEVNPNDQSTKPLFGDAGTATIVEYNESSNEMLFGLGSDGEGHKAIIIPDGGSRNKFNTNSLKTEITEGIERSKCDIVLEGMDVFSFGVNKVPKVVNDFFNHYSLNTNEIDYFIFHQANKMMNDRICKKLNIPEDKALYSIQKYGNTSSATIPLTINYTNAIKSNNKIFLCGFGVGLSWGSVLITLTKDIYCPDIIEYE
jgi:3-oxoacyl-[acyl-carrier-protein] synthase-3